jgi:nucleoside-diphosphate-sugar epimerase
MANWVLFGYHHLRYIRIESAVCISVLVMAALYIPAVRSFSKSLLIQGIRSPFAVPRRPLTQSVRLNDKKEGRLLILGGTGYLGQKVCAMAVDEGYSVVTLSRRGTPRQPIRNVEYRKGDAQNPESITSILNEGNICGVIHCIGLLFDDASGLGSLNQYVSGSKSLPDGGSTYDTITRLTAFNAIDAAMNYCLANNITTLPFCFTSAAEAGWPEVTGGKEIESIMPDFIHRYMVAKRAVEAKLMSSQPVLRPIIVRPSLIYSWDKVASLPAVAVFTLFNKIGFPFVDRPVTVDMLSSAIVRSIGDTSVMGVQRYPQIDRLGSALLYI